jgi:hypothetical protein
MGTGTVTVEDVKTKVTRATTVMTSAQNLIDGFKALLDKAVADALANGATAEELVPLTDLSNTMDTEATALAASVVANTGTKNPPPPPTV